MLVFGQTLTCRTAASALGVKHAAAARYLNMLCEDGVLEELTVGTKASGKASEYRYLGITAVECMPLGGTGGPASVVTP